MPMDPNKIRELLSQAKAPKGVYASCFVEFMNSDEPAINPAETWPQYFGDRKASAMVQSFRIAAKTAKAEKDVTITQVGDELYLIHNERARVVVAALDNTDEDTTTNNDTDEDNDDASTTADSDSDEDAVASMFAGVGAE